MSTRPPASIAPFWRNRQDRPGIAWLSTSTTDRDALREGKPQIPIPAIHVLRSLAEPTRKEMQEDMRRLLGVPR
jgi:hypothetical protein